MSTAPFGVGGKSRKPRACVEDVPRICIYDLQGVARSPFTGFAREATVDVVVNGAKMAIDVVCDARHRGGDGQRYFLCPDCSRKVWHLYVRDEQLKCRRCAGLDYRSKHTRRRGLNRVRRLREKIGALPSPLAPLPQRPRHVRRDYWMKALARIAAAETLVAAELHDMVVGGRRRLRDEQRRDRRARTAGRSDRGRDSQRSKPAGGSQGIRA